MNKKFLEHMIDGYQFDCPCITLGAALLDEEVVDAPINIPLKTLNRHGLIAGATGTGKTKTIQVLAENLSKNGVPVLLMDLKGDLSGLAVGGKDKASVVERHEKINIPYESTNFPVELLSLSDQKGVKLRATVSEFGPMLLSKILELNDTQSSIVAILFKLCDDKQMPLLDLNDFKKILNFAVNEGKKQIEDEYGRIAASSASAILRKVIELEQQGAEQFFGEPSFEVEDLERFDDKGRGYISILRLNDLQDRPKLFSTFMLCLLAEIYSKYPEEGDLEQPKLMVFIDEAHLLFKNASKALLNQVESIVKLIRSKGVGIIFCTQNPDDIPDAVLSQLGMKIQHALRAFTAKDRKAIKLAAENYPLSEFYKTDVLLTSLGIGEAAVTVLNDKGRPTPLAAVLLRAPESRMGPLNKEEISVLVSTSKIIANYSKAIDRYSAYEILNEKLAAAQAAAEQAEMAATRATQSTPKKSDKQATRRSKGAKKEESWVTDLSKNTMVRQMGRTVVREFARGLLGILGGKSR